MKKAAAGLAATLLLVGLGFAAPKPKSQSFAGEIMDSQCSAMGSHAGMLKEEGMADKDPNDAMAKQMCTDKCVKMGGKYVLFNSETKTVYQLTDQKKPAQFAGQKVNVKGKLNEEKKTIKVASIEKAS